MGEMGGNGGGGYSLPEGSGSEFFIFIFGALRSKDAIKISAPRAARQGPSPPPPLRGGGIGLSPPLGGISPINLFPPPPPGRRRFRGRGRARAPHGFAPRPPPPPP